MGKKRQANGSDGVTKDNEQAARASADDVIATERWVPGRLRRERMLELIKGREFVRVEEITERFGIYGQERPFEETEASFAAEKVAIGQAAAALVQDGESIILDVGTTAAAVARALVARTELRDVVVFTNGLKTALELESAIPRIAVVVVGGTLRPLQHSLVDPLATLILERITVKSVLLGCNGVDAVGGVTNINLPEAEIKRRMLDVATRRIVLADGSKIGRVEVARLCSVDEIDLVITGESADPDVVAALRERECEVQIAG